MKKVIMVTGLIGSGKTTLSREVAEKLEALWLSEPDEKESRNPYLADFYKDPERWGFIMQCHLLSIRYRQQLHAQWHVLNGHGHAVLDSSYWQDTCFARLLLKTGKMSEREFQTYQTLYHGMTAAVLLPTVCLRVLVSPETAQQRVLKRMEQETGRKCETAISLEYLRGLDQEIDHMVGVLKQQGVVVYDIPWDEDRDTPKARISAIAGIAARVQNLTPPDLFLDMHRRST